MMKTDFSVLIVGLGLIGGSYARGLSEAGVHVEAIDINPQSIQYALEKKWIKNGATHLETKLLEKADIIILGLYPCDVIDWVRNALPLIKKGTIITDVTGIKGAITKDIQELLDGYAEFIASHPMAGKEVSGVEYSDPSIFKNANFIITPTDENTFKAIETIRNIAKILNFKTVSTLSVDEHDEMIAFLSQLTHVIAVTLMNTNDNTHLVDYTGDSFRDLTRIAKINEHLWSQLFIMNKEKLLVQISDFQQELAHFKQVLETEQIDEMKRLFVQSTNRRKRFDK